MKDKYSTSQKEFEDKLKKQKYEFSVKQAVSGLKFSSNAARERFEQKAIEKNFVLENEKLLGFEDFVSSYKEEDEGAFAEDGDPVVFSGKSRKVGKDEQPKVHNSSEAMII